MPNSGLGAYPALRNALRLHDSGKQPAGISSPGQRRPHGHGHGKQRVWGREAHCREPEWENSNGVIPVSQTARKPFGLLSQLETGVPQDAINSLFRDSWLRLTRPSVFARMNSRHGPVAQLGARLTGSQEVRGSIPLRSTDWVEMT